MKDDFFDSISCGALDGGSRNGRARFSQQSIRDTNVCDVPYSPYQFTFSNFII